MSEVSKNSLSVPGIQKIVELAKLLRQNGDKVLSGHSKLSLSTSLLHNLNQVFHEIVSENEDFESSFQVCYSSKNKIFQDIKFLHDFVQKTVRLRIINDSNQIEIEISKFRHLRYLELQKVSIQLTKGIQSIRGQLECVICSGGRGVCKISHLLETCGGDNGAGFVWNSLNKLSLSYNTLKSLDKSLELTPWLQILDLSYNLITNAAELNCLPNLKLVNLGYNKLETMPSFHRASFHTLQKLILKNNYIDNMNGLQGLENLIELDLSYNCITDHYNLWPLESMSGLLWVSFEGNPIAYHPNHRLFSLKHLHPSLSSSKFILDHSPLSKSERMLVAENRGCPMRSMGSLARDHLSSGLSNLSSDYSSAATLDISLENQASATDRKSADLMNSLSSSIVNMTRVRRKQTVKEAVIADNDNDIENNLQKQPLSLSSSSLETSMDHLETKRKILALRKQFGEDNWLSDRAATVIQNIMGIESVKNESSPSTLSVPIIKIADLTDYSNDDKTEENSESNSRNERISAEWLVDSKEESDELSLITEAEIRDPEPLFNPEDELGDLYLVQKKKNEHELQEVFLILTPDHVKERDHITGRMMFRWSTNSILSCVLGRGAQTTVDIIFDTTRKDRQNRTYLVETDDGKKIVEFLNKKIRTRSIELKVFKCMKCSTHFSHDTAISTTSMLPGLEPPKCPTCKSSLVIQTDEYSSPEIENVKKNQTNNKYEANTQEDLLNVNLAHSESHSSIGGKKCEAINVPSTLGNSNSNLRDSICSSATSLEDSRESTPSGGTTAKKSESDIEVLSNPSQSSIEVLDEVSKSNLTPNRMRSEEANPSSSSHLMSPDTTPIMAGLTESSSSGSMTDSVCTAYEKSLKLCDISEISESEHNLQIEAPTNLAIEKESVLTPVTNLTSMLGELLQTMRIGSTKTTPIKLEASCEFTGSDVRYSYTDFSSLDHRVKLHIILNIFEQEEEELVLLLRADILMQKSLETFAGCLVLSTSKVYVLRIIGPEGEDPQRWLRKEMSWTIDRLRSFAPLPFKQGILVQLEIPSRIGEESQDCTILCILQDFQRTSSFLFYLTEVHLPGNCEVEFTVPEHCNSCIKKVLLTSNQHREEDPVRLLAMFTSALIKSDNSAHSEIKRKFKISGLVTTCSALIILEDNLQWLLPYSKQTPDIALEQALSNLIAVDVELSADTENGSASLYLSFSDDVAGVEEIWTLNFVSFGAAESVVNSIQAPWEELFSVPLQVNTRIFKSQRDIKGKNSKQDDN